MSPSDRPAKTIRCAIYTRKSSEEGLEQDFNSLDAQREACEAYIRSQKQEGWAALPTIYNDGGYSGGTMERPALGNLLLDIKAGKVDVVVVYKIDRLTRSLLDFAKIVEIFDKAGVSFVSITQQFNTTTSMGRLTLNVLLSFAQFEREVTGERIRDKIAASKRKGMWMGGCVPIGYEVKQRKLIIVEKDAELVRKIFSLYLKLGNVRLLKEELDGRSPDIQSPADDIPFSSFSRGHLYRILANPIYAGLVAHKGQTFAGLHEAIIPKDQWEAVQRLLQENASRQRLRESAKESSPLAGLLFDHTGDRLTPSHAVKAGKRYRYYVANRLIRGDSSETGLRLPATEIESAIARLVVEFLSDERRMFDLAERHGSDQIHIIIGKVRTLAAKIRPFPPYRQLQEVKSTIKRIVVGSDTLNVALSWHQWMKLLAGNKDEKPKAADEDIALSAPLSLQYRGQETCIMLNGAESVSRAVDRTLLTSLARGYAWRQEIIADPSTSASAIAARERVTSAYVSRLIELSFLAPDIVEGIVSGNQPTSLTFHRLRAMSIIPLDWVSQRQFFR